MKTLTSIILVSLFLAGCAVARFDNNELSFATDIRYLIKQDNACNNASDAAILAKKLAEKTSYFAMYVEHTPNNVETIQMITELNKDAQSFDRAYQDEKKPSVAYCKNKLEIMAHSADTVQKSMAIKPRK